MRAVGRALLALVALVAATAPALAACPGTAMPPPRETIPAPLDWAEWRTMVDALALRLRGPEVARAQLVFVGDSITQGWHPNVFQNF